MEFSVRFRMAMKVESGISKFGYLVAMRIEMEADYTLEIRALALDDELMVEVPRRSCSLEYARKPISVTDKKARKEPTRLSSLNY